MSSADYSRLEGDIAPPSRPRSILVAIDGQRAVFSSAADAFRHVARVYASDIREAREREVETSPDLSACHPDCDRDECPHACDICDEGAS